MLFSSPLLRRTILCSTAFGLAAGTVLCNHATSTPLTLPPLRLFHDFSSASAGTISSFHRCNRDSTTTSIRSNLQFSRPPSLRHLDAVL